MATLKDDLFRSFTEGVTWPIDAASLAALTDMGMSDERIAQYFGVRVEEVERLRKALETAPAP